MPLRTITMLKGGIYADIDVLLESDLDMIIDDDIGFMIPLDSDPGRNNNHTMCLWNGLLAAAPGHPFLAAVIEAVVNNVRNKFTRVDIMQSMCPTVDLHMTRAWDLLHISEYKVETYSCFQNHIRTISGPFQS